MQSFRVHNNLFPIADHSNPLRVVRCIALFDKRNFFLVVNGRADTGNDSDGEQNAKTVNPCDSQFTRLLLVGQVFFAGNADDSNENEQFEHEVVKSVF